MKFKRTWFAETRREFLISVAVATICKQCVNVQYVWKYPSTRPSACIYASNDALFALTGGKHRWNFSKFGLCRWITRGCVESRSTRVNTSSSSICERSGTSIVCRKYRWRNLKRWRQPNWWGNRGRRLGEEDMQIKLQSPKRGKRGLIEFPQIKRAAPFLGLFEVDKTNGSNAAWNGYNNEQETELIARWKPANKCPEHRAMKAL